MIIMGTSGTVCALDRSTGKPKWTSGVGSLGVFSPAILADGTVLVASGGTLYALDYTTGARKWSSTGSGHLTSPALGPDGTIYVGSTGGLVYAFYGSAPLANSPWPMLGHDPQHTGRATSLVPPLRLDRAALVNGRLQLQWSGNGVLQSAHEVQGPWQDLPATNGSYSTAAEGAHRFFRLRSR